MDFSPSSQLLSYFSSPGAFTDPGEYALLLDNLPAGVSELSQIVQNNLLHVFWAERYGRLLTEAEKDFVNVRSVARKLAAMHENDPRPLSAFRTIQARQVGNCRDFTLMLTAILRHQQIPARARCGFGAYFSPDHYEDHWVCEYWHADQRRWVLVDAQLDQFQCNELNVNFNPLDVPRDQFIVAGQAWQMCRLGQADPQQFGIFDWHGWWFIWGNVIRELMAFNKIELLPWDVIPTCMSHELDDPLPSGPELAFCDGIAAFTLAGDPAFPTLQAIVKQNGDFQIPEEVWQT